jgi:hypothetical protein
MKRAIRRRGWGLVVVWLVAAASACSAAEPGTLLEDHFRDGVSAEWSAVGYGGPERLDPAQAALGKDPVGRHFLEIRSGAHIGKNCSQWKDYRLTFSFRLPEPAADGAQLLRVIVRGPAANIWAGYNVYLFNAGGKFKIQANVWPTNPSATTPIAVDSQWHRLSIRVLGQELEAELDDRSDARVATTDVYDASTVGGIYLGFSPGKWQLADVRVVALRPILEAADVLARYCLFAYHPSLDTLAVKADLGECSDQPWARGVTAIRFAVQPAGKDAVLAQGEIALDAKKFGTAEVQLPKLPEGQYELKLATIGAPPTTARRFVRRIFPWERNSLGITAQVYPPFEPISVQGRDVKVVGRVYRMNDLGLWDRVQSQGHDLLAGPITLRCETSGGPVAWRSGDGRFRQVAAGAAVFEGSAESPAVVVRTTSTVEFDGCMKVEMDLVPRAGGPAVQQLWLEIPLADREVPLFFPQLSGCRENYSGLTPRGGKIVWQPRTTEWMNFPARTWKAEPGPEDGVIWTPRACYQHDFAYYLWLGGAERGLAWFAENDRGYVVDPQGDTQSVRREGQNVVLRIYLVNRAGLDGPRHVVFGLQASPTRPMPRDWRRNVAVPIHGGPDMGIGGYMCADKYPADHDFTIVERVLEARRSGTIDEAFFRRKDAARSHQPALSHGTEPWLTAVLGAAGIARMYTRPEWIEVQGGMLPADVRAKALGGPFPSYFEEHCMNVDTPEWEVFQDEWGQNEFTLRQWRKMDTFMCRIEGNTMTHMANANVVITPSYADFAVWYANEWLKRGVSLYLDNSMLTPCSDPRKSAAYRGPDGRVVPAVLLWSQRDYYKRMWNLRCQWNQRGVAYPLTISHHVTNTQMLPLHTWVDKLSDLEWVAKSPPVDPDFLLTETVARQIGAYSDLIVPLTRDLEKSVVYKESGMGPESLVRMEWGMRMVHEISRWGYPFGSVASAEPARRLEKAVWDFGYGLPACRVQNYWGDDAVVQGPAGLRWLALVSETDRRIMLVLQSYDAKPGDARLVFDVRRLGFAPRGTVTDVETGQGLGQAGATVAIPMNRPYATRVIICAAGPLSGGVAIQRASGPNLP